jgi:murein DD-endopeptidase MepM/ murein hydrolase activator NlpD
MSGSLLTSCSSTPGARSGDEIGKASGVIGRSCKLGLCCTLGLLAWYPSMTHRGHASLAYPKVSATLGVEPFVAPLRAAGSVRTAVRYHKVRNRESLSGILQRWGVERRQNESAVQSCERLLRTRVLRAGRMVRGTFDPMDGKLEALEIAIDEERLLVARVTPSGAFEATIEPLELERRVERHEVRLRDALRKDAAAAGIPAGLLPALTEVYSFVLDLDSELGPGDSIRVLAETFYHRGNFQRSGEILAAEVFAGGKAFPAYRFRGQYYDGEGRSLRRALLRSPLLEYRLSSTFRHSRVHPVTGKRRPHRGADLAANYGDPVRSVGDGQVVFIGSNGGYGRMVKIRHDETYTSLYAHLSRYAPDLQVGGRVKQGETIGFVGQSGLATGPHVHYELYVDGRVVNPMEIELPAAGPVEPEEWPAFRSEADALASRLGLAATPVASLLPRP